LDAQQPKTATSDSKPSVRPEVNQIDHLIGEFEGSTIALSTTIAKLQMNKTRRIETSHERYKHLVTDLEWHQRENEFYTVSYESYQELYARVLEVCQDLALQSLFEPKSSPLGDPFLLDGIQRLNTAVKVSKSREVHAEQGWKSYWGIPTDTAVRKSWI
jgi:hypothetical protein